MLKFGTDAKIVHIRTRNIHVQNKLNDHLHFIFPKRY